MIRRPGFAVGAFGVALLATALIDAATAVPALAQAHNPFSVGISEGGGSTTGWTGWLLSQQGLFERSMAAAVKAMRSDGSAVWLLSGLSFLYGILHAAGPGHGKAVLAAYMVASRRALRRGIILSFLAALLQAGVAIFFVSLLSFVFHATALGMREGAALIEKLSYCGIAVLGAFLVWRKGQALVQAWRVGRPFPRPAVGTRQSGDDLAYAGLRVPTAPARRRYSFDAAASFESAQAAGADRRFVCVAAHDHGPSCGHVHAPDPSTLGDEFSWRDAVVTIFAAGSRPCSGAILVLVFAAAQGIFAAGIAAALVMALGTAITTAALAALAVLAKSLALRLCGPASGGAASGRGALIARSVEFCAACLVLAVGLSLLAGVGPLQALS